MAIFSFIDVDAKKLGELVEPLVILALGAGMIWLLYQHMQQQNQADEAAQASQASADYVNGIEQLSEINALGATSTGSTTGTSTTGSSEQPSYSAPNSNTVAPTLSGSASAGTLQLAIPQINFDPLPTNFGGPSTGSGA